LADENLLRHGSGQGFGHIAREAVVAIDTTTLLVAVLGVAGTLSSPVLGQRIASRARQQEFDLQSQQRREEREAAQRQSAFEERRAMYAALNTSARQYQQELGAYLHVISSDSVTDEPRGDLTKAREGFRELYSDAQMILPDRVLDQAMSVSASLGEAYGMVKRLETAKPRAKSTLGSVETIEMAREYIRGTVYDLIIQLRQLMRSDLGVSDRET
jgi:type II secretory pathway pseudopilin PulG